MILLDGSAFSNETRMHLFADESRKILLLDPLAPLEISSEGRSAMFLLPKFEEIWLLLFDARARVWASMIDLGSGGTFRSQVYCRLCHVPASGQIPQLTFHLPQFDPDVASQCAYGYGSSCQIAHVLRGVLGAIVRGRCQGIGAKMKVV